MYILSLSFTHHVTIGSRTIKATKPTVAELIERKRKNVQGSSKISNLPSPKKKKENNTVIAKEQNMKAAKGLSGETREIAMKFPSNFSSKDCLDQDELDKLLVPSLLDEKKKTPMAQLLEDLSQYCLMV